MNIGLISPKYMVEDQTYLFNYGLALTSAWLKQHGYNVHCLNPNHYDVPVEEQIEKFINANNLDVIYSEETFVWHRELKKIFEASKTVKPSITTIAGGTVVSNNLRTPFWGVPNIDYGIVGDVEETILELLKGFNKNIKGIAFFDKEHKYILTEPRVPFFDLDMLPIPDYEGFEYDKYIKLFYPSENHFYSILDEVRPGNILTSRSCPYRCTFCYVHLNRAYRQRSMDSIFNEIDYLVKTYDINFLNINDLLFSTNKQRLIDFAHRIKKYNIKWWAQMRVSYVDDEVLKTLKDSGMFMTSYGIESVNPKILKSMKKHITKEQIENALRLSHENKLNIQGNIIIGDLEETKETAKESINWLKENNHYGLNLVMIRTHPGSCLYKYAVSSGKIKNEMEHLNKVFPLVDLTEMSDKEYNKISIYTETYPLDPDSFFDGKIISSSVIDNIYSLKIKCPHCGSVSTYKNMHHTSLKTHFKVICRDCHVHLRIDDMEAYPQDYEVPERIVGTLIKEIKKHSNSNFIVNNIYCMGKLLKGKIWN